MLYISGGGNLSLVMLGFMSVTAMVSMWISNTAATAMMMPIVDAVVDAATAGEGEEKRDVKNYSCNMTSYVRLCLLLSVDPVSPSDPA